jgi:hypothetical protein
MRRSSWTPSIVPGGDENDQTVYLVADDFGKVGRAWRETDYEASDLEAIVQDLLTGQYSNPIRVIAFNTAERWSEDVSEDVAQVGEAEHVKVFANQDAAETWFEQNDPEGVAFEYEVPE